MGHRGANPFKEFGQNGFSIKKAMGIVALLVMMTAAIFKLGLFLDLIKGDDQTKELIQSIDLNETTVKEEKRIKPWEQELNQGTGEQELLQGAGEQAELMKKADLLAASYDYEKAIEKLRSWKNYEAEEALQDKIKEYEAAKATMVEVDLNEVTHVFYHSLVVDPRKGFENQDWDRQAAGNNQWMTTIDEFKKIMKEMYQRGYVLVSIHDLAQETIDENGQRVIRPGKIMLPPGKKAYVLSIDDLSYYHSYDGYGFASKLVLVDGKLKNEYIDDNGQVLVGDYDIVPILDQFIEENPDAAYQNARGLIALTGYNGIFGYRTDQSYQEVPYDLDRDKVVWLQNNADFNLEQERAEAKKIADALKLEGWEFASHTWGHLKVGESSVEKLRADTKRWKENVEPIVGSTDVIVFAHGEDLQEWGQYDLNNDKFQHYYKEGFRFFCNVDSSQYRLWLGDTYVRQGRRNLDGYRIFFNAIGKMNSLSDLFEAKDIIDPLRPPVYPLKN